MSSRSARACRRRQADRRRRSRDAYHRSGRLHRVRRRRMQQSFVRSPQIWPDGWTRRGIRRTLPHRQVPVLRRTLRPTLSALLRRSDVVLMDLQGFRPPTVAASSSYASWRQTACCPPPSSSSTTRPTSRFSRSTVDDQAGEAHAVPLNLERHLTLASRAGPDLPAALRARGQSADAGKSTEPVGRAVASASGRDMTPWPAGESAGGPAPA